MTFQTIPISQVIINRDHRQRKELVGLEELADSIREVGLINPIYISKDNVLVAGERRFTACRDILGWTSIPVHYAESLDPEALHLIELEENVKREALPWKDECLAVDDYVTLQKAKGHSLTEIAGQLGLNPRAMGYRLDIAKALAEGVDLVTNATAYSVARGVVERINQRKAADSAGQADARMDAMLGKDADPLGDNISFDDTPPQSEPAPEPLSIEIPFRHEDFNQWVNLPHTTKYNFLHCDFPYGIGADKHKQGSAKSLGGYDDSSDVYFSLLDSLEVAMETCIAPSAHMMFWFSMDYYDITRERLTGMGWKVSEFPLIWYKSDNTGVLPDPKRGPRRIYETAFHCTRGDRYIVRAKGNAFGAPVIKTVHMSEKNPHMLQHFFQMYVDESTYMLDPTMGSGQAVRVAERMQAAHSLGLERDEEFYKLACRAYEAAAKTEEDLV